LDEWSILFLNGTMTFLYPVMSSQGELLPDERWRLGTPANLLRLSVGIEAVEDIAEDLERGELGLSLPLGVCARE
jgi:cystathionine beta-lyase/cystathionine gamma-synthase